MMRVLMFGWEFPPHISGGLGTACYGLTSALIKENTEVLFVVPKLYSNEPQNGSTFINASEIETSHESATRSTIFDRSVKTIRPQRPIKLVWRSNGNINFILEDYLKNLTKIYNG